MDNFMLNLLCNMSILKCFKTFKKVDQLKLFVLYYPSDVIGNL